MAKPDRGTRALETVVAADLVTAFSPASVAETLGAPDGTLPPVQSELPPASSRYVRVRELGRGGMGKVDAVFDRALQRVVARKSSTDPKADERSLLLAEAQTCAQLEHPAIVPVYDVSVDERGAPHYTMRVIRGRTLRGVLDDDADAGKMTLGLAQTLGIVRQVCLAVDYAHSRGVVHRDLKPDNVIVGEFGEVYVLDWGVAHVMATSEVRRVAGGVGAGDVAGSPGYMAPEQIEGREIGPATDVFALGVILYEILCGEVPFEQRDLTFASRAFQKAPLPPSRLRPLRNVPAALDRAALACLAVEPGSRPASARWIAEEIDAFLEGERARAEREREADELASLGERAIALFEEKDAEARRLRERSEDALASISTWEPPDRKAAAWDLGDRARDLASEAARALAEAEARFIQALGRVSTHRRARRGLTALELRQFEAAEREGDSARAAKFLDLARAHDDGTFALELSDQGEITIDSGPRGLVAVAARYVERGRRLVLEEEIPLGRTPTFAHRVPSGSWLIRLVTDAGELRCPVLVRRAHRHAVRARVPSPREVPEGMVLVPGGPFLARRDARGERLTAESLSDFAIGRFPVTLRMYAEFLDDLDEAERVRRVPHFRSGETRPLLLREGSGRWRAAPHLVEGAARARVGRDRELEIPAFMLSWYDAVAYTRWLAAKTQRKYRLPTDLEWEKAARGADGRLFPMGPHLDASFAKRRESRPEPPQPEPVGAFEWDESPYGVRDLAGGVADLTETSPDGRPLDRNFVEAHPEEVLPVGEPFVVFRGGWEAMTTASRTPMRNSQPLSERAGYVGFRLALSLDEHGSSELVVEPMERPTGSGAP